MNSFTKCFVILNLKIYFFECVHDLRIWHLNAPRISPLLLRLKPVLLKERCKIQVLIKIQVNYEKVVCITVWILPVDIQRLNSQVRCTFSVRNMPLSQVLGNFNLLVSAPAFILYYLLYSTFNFNDPEGFVTDTTVNTCFKFKCQLRVR